MADYLNIAGRIRTTASDGVAMEAQEVKDLNLNKSQQEVNADVQTELGDRYTKEETYSKEQLDDLITTPDVNRVYVIATNLTTAVTDLLPETGSSDTLYNVGNWNGTQYDTTVYSIYGWDGTAYVCLAVRSFVGEVYDISANHPDGQGNPTPYADLAAALGTGGANVPVGIRRGGMSIKFIQGTAQSSDNNYVQYQLTANTFTTDTTEWQGVFCFTGTFIGASDSNLANIKATGIYKRVPPVGSVPMLLFVEANGNGSIINQTRIVLDTYIKFSTRRTTNSGTTWSDWSLIEMKYDASLTENSNKLVSSGTLYSIITPLLTKTFTGSFTGMSDSDLASMTTAGIYKRNQPAGSVPALLFVNVSGVHIQQTKIILDGYIKIYTRTSGSSGTNWSEWKLIEFDFDTAPSENSNKLVSSGLIYSLVNNIYDITNAIKNGKTTELDITEQQEVRYGIVAQGYWYPTTTGIIGTSYVIPFDKNLYNKISFDNEQSGNVSIAFLKSLANMTTATGVVDYAEGETGRRTYANGHYEIYVPAGTNFIVTVATTSSGTPYAISNLELIAEQPFVKYVNDSLKPLESQIPTYGTKEIENPRYTVVSDCFEQTASDLGDYLIDTKKMHGVAIHLGSYDKYYETEGLHVIDIWSMMNPNQAKHFDVTVTGETDSEGNAIGKPFMVYFRQINRSIRIAFSCKGGANEEYPWYKDFNLDTYQGGVATPILYNGAHIDITAFNALLNAAGYQSETKSEGGPRIIGRINGPAKTENVGGTDYDYVYCLVHMNQYAIIMKTKDNFANLEYVSVFPYPIEYEGTIMYLDGTFYIYYRTSSGMRLTTTTDFVTYTTVQICGNLSHRGEMCIYNDEVYITTTWDDNLNDYIPAKRTNFSIYKGTGDDFSTWEKVLNVSDAAGTVSPVALPISGQYTMVFTTSPFHSDWINQQNKAHMGKDCVAFYSVRYLKKRNDIPISVPY